MKIILFAFTNWGIKGLQTLIQKNHEILCVYTHPMNMDKNEKIWFGSVKEECEKNNIPVKEKTKLEENDERFIKKLNPDIIFSLNWRRLLPKSIYEIPKNGTINIHAGYLPKYRGFAPINWAIINGEKEIAVTAHYIDETADTGDIVTQKKIDVRLEDSATDVYNYALNILPKVIVETISNIESGIKPKSQKNVKGFLCVKRFPEDGRINWILDRFQVYNLIRALSDPFPNAFCFFDGTKILVRKAKLMDDDYRGPPGGVYNISEEGIVVTCGNNHKENQAILITEIAVNNKTMNPKDYFKKLWAKLE